MFIREKEMNENMVIFIQQEKILKNKQCFLYINKERQLRI